MSERRRRYMRQRYIWTYLKRRPHQVLIGSALLGAIGILFSVSYSTPDYWKNLGVNIQADFIGLLVVLFVIAPFIKRAELRIDSVLERFDHQAFIRQAADARRKIVILTTWTDLLHGGYRDAFLGSLQAALKHDVKVRILLLGPDSKAAEQRSNDLLQQQTNVVEKIYENLQTLHKFQKGCELSPEGKLEVRIYSALPPVQMYQVDDRVIVSFYPLNSSSWCTTQYQTNPYGQLGEFVSEKFDELWDASSTRTLNQFREITVWVGLNEILSAYPVEFARSSEAVYVCGKSILNDHWMHGLGGLQARIVEGEHEIVGLYFFSHLETNSQECKDAQYLFNRKYGLSVRDALLKLVKISSTT